MDTIHTCYMDHFKQLFSIFQYLLLYPIYLILFIIYIYHIGPGLLHQYVPKKQCCNMLNFLSELTLISYILHNNKLEFIEKKY